MTKEYENDTIFSVPVPLHQVEEMNNKFLIEDQTQKKLDKIISLLEDLNRNFANLTSEMRNNRPRK